MTDGPYVEAKEHLASVTIVDGESEERRPILHEAGVEM